MVAAPTLTLNQGANPFVEVFPTAYFPNTTSVRIERESDGRIWSVRGGVSISTGVAVLDFEVPFGVESLYRVECFDNTGLSLGYTDNASITVNETRTIIHQPLMPQLWVSALRLEGTGATIERPSDSTLVRAEGASLPQTIGSNRWGITDLPVNLYLDSIEEADTLQAMLGSYTVKQLPILVIRTPPPMRIPRTFFAHVGNLPEHWITPGRDANFSYNLTVTEVMPPFPGLTTPLLTYDDIDAAFASYTTMDAAYPSYTARDRAYDLAGTA